MTAFILNLIVILMTFNNADCDTLSADFDLCMYSEDSEEVICIPGVLIVDLEKNHEKVHIRMDMKSASEDGTLDEQSITYLWRFDRNVMYLIDHNKKNYSTNMAGLNYSAVFDTLIGGFLNEYAIEKKITLNGTDETIAIKDNKKGDGSFILMIKDPEYGNVARVVELRAQKPSFFIISCYLHNLVINKPLDNAVFEIPEGYEEN